MFDCQAQQSRAVILDVGGERWKIIFSKFPESSGQVHSTTEDPASPTDNKTWQADESHRAGKGRESL